jgi:hypothetical protein
MDRQGHFVFKARNYSLLLISVSILVLGFLLMTGEGNYDMKGFNEDIYSFRRITLSPIILLSGYVLMIVSIMTGSGKPKNSNNG